MGAHLREGKAAELDRGRSRAAEQSQWKLGLPHGEFWDDPSE